MENRWKRLALISAAAGAGAVLAAALAVGGILLYSSRPQHPKPWNSKAIIATFDYPDTEGDTKTIVLYYTVENTSELDYRMSKKEQLEINGRLKREDSLATSKAGISIDESETFFPAKHRRRFSIHLAFPVDADLGPQPQTKAESRRQWKIIADILKQKLPNLNGFVILDVEQRYEIDFPNGWDNIDLNK
jgi:hypothetical protein